MSAKTIEDLLEENNRLLAEQNRLLAQAIATSRGAAVARNLESIRARARRETPWGCKPPVCAR